MAVDLTDDSAGACVCVRACVCVCVRERESLCVCLSAVSISTPLLSQFLVSTPITLNLTLHPHTSLHFCSARPGSGSAVCFLPGRDNCVQGGSGALEIRRSNSHVAQTTDRGRGLKRNGASPPRACPRGGVVVAAAGGLTRAPRRSSILIHIARNGPQERSKEGALSTEAKSKVF